MESSVSLVQGSLFAPPQGCGRGLEGRDQARYAVPRDRIPRGLVLVVALVLVAGAAWAAATRPHAKADWRCVQVRPGDTLWTLAKRVSAGDPRPVIDAIGRRNGLSDGFIAAGQQLWVPPSSGRATGSYECVGKSSGRMG